MTKGSSAKSLQDLYFALGWHDDESSSVIGDFINHVANGGLQRYKTIFQTGAKHGEPLYNHVLNMIFVAERLQPLLDLSDIETRVLYAAVPVHDLNKVGERTGVSFNRLATLEAVKKELERISVPAFFPDYSNYLEDITLLVRSHSGHFHTDGEFLIRAHNPYRLDRDRLDRILRPLIRALDNLELSVTLSESTNKQDFLAFLNSISNIQYEFGYHQVIENRGILTNLVQNQVTGYLEERYGLVPLLFYPDGVAYLVEKRHAPHITPDDLATIGKRVATAGARISRGNFTKFIGSGNQGIKVDRQCLALGTSFPHILDYIYTLVMRKVTGKRFNIVIVEVERKARERLEMALTDPTHGYLHPHISDRLKTPLCPSSREAMGAGELLRSYYIFLSDHLAKQVGDPWRYLYRWLKIGEEMIPFYDLLDPRYQRAYVITGDLGLSLGALYDSILEDGRRLMGEVEQREDQALGDFAALADYVTRHVTFSFETDQQIDFAAALQAYVESNHHQCCYCGSEFKTSAWMAQHVPADISVQSFSNRLPGGWGKEPKKNICLVCRAQFILEKLNRSSVKNVKTFYLHLYPYTFYTDVFLRALSDRVNDLLATDTTVVMLRSDDALRETSSEGPLRLITRTKAGKPHTFGLALPQYAEFVGNVIIFPMNCPGENDAEQFLFALQNVLVMQRFLGCKAVLTSSPVPPVNRDAFNDFFVDGIPLGFEGLLPEPGLDRQAVNELWDRMSALIRLRSELYNPEREENSPLVFARAMADLSGLSVFHEADRMVELRARSGGASGDQRMWRTIAITRRILSDVNIAANGGLTMQALTDLATMGWRDRIIGRSLERNSLLKPFDMILEALKGKSDAFNVATLRAALVEDIFRHLEVIASQEYKPGRTKREKVKDYVDLFFTSVLEGVYRGNINRLLSDGKGLRSAYLFYLREQIPLRDREDESLSVAHVNN
jgi:CRISPR-associated protein Csc3